MASRAARFCALSLAAALAAAAAGAARAQVTIALHSRTFVPAPGLSSADLAALLGQAPTALARVYALVQTNGVPTTPQVAALKALGLVRVVAVRNHGWIASLPRSAAAMNAIVAHPAVRSIVPLLTTDRISRDIALDGIDARLIDSTGKALLNLLIADDLPVATALPYVLPLVASVEAQSDVVHSLRVRAAPANLNALASLGFVVLVDEAPEPGTDDNDTVRVNTRASQVQILEDVVDGAGAVIDVELGEPYALDGSGVLISQWETGRPDTCHPDFRGTLAGDGAIAGLQRRIQNGSDDDLISDDDCDDPLYDPEDDLSISQHATHVAGTIVGNGSQSLVEGTVERQYRGMAPNAGILAWIRPVNLAGNGDSTAFERENQAAQYATATAGGSVISSNSWNYRRCHDRPNQTCYEQGAEAYDRFITDAANPARDRAIAIIGSASNEGEAGSDDGFGTTGIPNSAKNTIAVGNIESDTYALTTHSSRGPVDDGRLKPDIVAPGDRAGAGGFGINSTTPMDDVSYPYVRYSGTSMAAPVVSGAAALLVQQFRLTSGANPWPSTLKALLIHGARDQCCTDLGGFDVDGVGPDYGFGYGAIDVRASLDLLRDARGAVVVQSSGFSGSGACSTDPAVACDYDADAATDDDEYTVELPAGLASYRATLVWDDFASTELMARGERTLNDDLDLYLVAPDTSVHRAWVLDPDAPAADATRGRNGLDPVEVVDVANPAAGTWRIVVRPSLLETSDVGTPTQRYTLVYTRPVPDVMIRDRATDDGGVPSARRQDDDWVPGRYWAGPDVVIDGGEVVRPGELRSFHVAVTNRGPTTVSDATVDLFFSRQGIGLDYDDFTAHAMGSCALPELSPGERSVLADCTIPYTFAAGELELGEDEAGHVCLLARVVAGGDAVTFPGSASLPAGANPPHSYVPWDNNLAQQNLALEDVAREDGSYDVDVHNPDASSAQPVEVVIDASELPPGWTASLEGGPIFSTPAGGFVSTRLHIQPPAAAVHGASGRASIFGRAHAGQTLLSGVTATLVDADRDGDAWRDPEGGVPGPVDNCPATANSTQADVNANGRGNACECGDANDDGVAASADATRLRQHLAGISPPLSAAGLAKCSVIGAPASCNVLDLTVLRRAFRMVPLAPGITQTCSAAGV